MLFGQNSLRKSSLHWMRVTKPSWSGKKRSKQLANSTRNALSKKKATANARLISLAISRDREPIGRGRSKKLAALTKRVHSVHYSMTHMTSMISLWMSLKGSREILSNRLSSKSRKCNSNYASHHNPRSIQTWTSKSKIRISKQQRCNWSQMKHIGSKET